MPHLLVIQGARETGVVHEGPLKTGGVPLVIPRPALAYGSVRPLAELLEEVAITAQTVRGQALAPVFRRTEVKPTIQIVQRVQAGLPRRHNPMRVQGVLADQSAVLRISTKGLL